MKTMHWVLFIGLLCASLAGPVGISAPDTAAYPSAWSVWTAPPADKIQPTTAPGSQQAVVVEGAQGASEAYQVIVRAVGGPLSGVNLEASALSDGHGHTIPAASVVFFRQVFIDFTGVEVSEEGNLPVPENSPSGDAHLPDALLPFTNPYSGAPLGAPFSVAAGLNQPIWLDVNIPASAAAGTYTGQVTVSAQGEASISIPLTLTVWDFALPAADGIPNYFGMHMGDIIRYHAGTWACSGTNCWLDWNVTARTIVKRYETLAHEHRLSVWPMFIPDPGGDECQPPNDWSAYDAAVRPYMDGSYWPDGVPSAFLETPFAPGVDWGLEADCTPAQYTALAQAWAQHLKAQGWFNKALVYAYDEPPDEVLPAILEDAQRMQAGDPGWKRRILVTTAPTPNNISTLNPALGIYTICLRCYEDWSFDGSTPAGEIYYGRAEWPGLFAQGIRLWFYESNAQSAPYPTFASNTLLGAEPQIMLWGAWYEHAEGFLLWDTTAWNQDDPWGPNVDYGKTGDGVLLYPGNHNGLAAPLGSPAEVAVDGPIPSYRLKMVRAGLQDWALFQMAERYGLGDFARQQVALAYKQLGGCGWEGCTIPSFYWKAEAELMAQVRHAIAQAIIAQRAALAERVYLPHLNTTWR